MMPTPPLSNLLGVRQSPLDALSTFLSGTTPTFDDSVPPTATDARNPALVGAIRQKYGLGPDNLGISQDDLEALDSFVRGSDVRDKISEAVAPIEAKGAYDLQGEGMKDQTSRDVENLRGQYGLQGETIKAQSARDVAGLKANGSATDPQIVSNLADQAQRDFPGVVGKLPNALKTSVVEELGRRGVDVNSLTNQTRQMGETAHILLDPQPGQATGQLDQLIQQGEQLHQNGGLGLVDSPVRQFFANHGATSLLGVTPDAPSQLAEFESRLQGMKKEIQRGLAGARGASNSQMSEQFDKMFNARGDIETFKGEAEAMRNLLRPWATAAGYPDHGSSSVGAAGLPDPAGVR